MRSASGVRPMTSVPIGLRSLHSRAHHRMVRHRAGIRRYDVGVVEMLHGDLDHQQRARREGRIGLVIGGLPGVGDAGLDEDDQAGDELAVRASANGCGTDPARRGRAPPRGRRRRGSGRPPWPCARGPSSRLLRASGTPRWRGGFLRRPRATLCSSLPCSASRRFKPAEFAHDDAAQRALQIGVAVELAFQERPLEPGRWSPAAGRAISATLASMARDRRRRAACPAAPGPWAA